MFSLTYLAFVSLLASPTLAYITCSVLDYGAVADNSTDLGPAITETYNDCVKSQTTSDAGDVLLYIPSGNYLLASNVLLDDAENFEFHIAGDIYLPFNPDLTGTMIEFENCNNIIFTGPGAIYGNGYWYRPDGDLTLYPNRPRLLRFQNCNSVQLSQVTLYNSPQFHVTIIGDNNVVTNMAIRADFVGETDGFDISGNNNYVNDVSVQNGDECVTVKTPTDGFIAEDITCIGTGGCNIGSFGDDDTTVAINNVTYNGVTISNSDAGSMIKSYPNNAGYVTNVEFKNVVCDACAYPIYISVFWAGDGDDTGSLEISEINYVGWSGTGTSTRPAVLVDCNKASPCSKLYFDDVDITGTTGYTFTNACGTGLSGIDAC